MAIELSGRPFSGCTKLLIVGFCLFVLAVIQRAQHRGAGPALEEPAAEPQPRVVATLNNAHAGQTLSLGPRWQIRWWSQSGDLRIGLTDVRARRDYLARDFNDRELAEGGNPLYPHIESSSPYTVTIGRGGKFQIWGIPVMAEKNGDLVEDRWTIEIAELP